jgi:hypothetical protein
MVIYIREAHPKDGWWLGRGISGIFLRLFGSRAATDVYEPKTIKERRAVAKRCEVELQYEIPMYVDGMDNWVNQAYAAWPTRLYLIGMDGRVIYAGGLGPLGFKLPELKAAIESYIKDMD